MLKKVFEYITEYNMISPDDEITVGVSGGADSVCLLLNLVEYQKEVPFSIKVVHINHLIRTEAGSDAEFVKNLCDRFKLPFFLFEKPVLKIAKEEGISTEEAGRKVRYESFSLVSQGGKVAVAHNSNDVAETVLFNMFRGTGLEGLASLEPVNGNIIRPLLGVTREEIEEYLQKAGECFVTDKTNFEDDYARNKIRNRILPFAEENIVKGATAHIASLSEKMRLVRHYIEKETQIHFQKVVTQNQDSLCIDLTSYNEMDILMKQEIILLGLEKLTAGRKDIGEKHIEAILSIVECDGEKKVNLPYNLEAVKQYENLFIRKKKSQEDCAEEIYISIDAEGVYSLGNDCTVKVRLFSYDGNGIPERNTYTKWFDYDKISNCPIVRTRQTGDYLTINSDMATKSLKDYMISEKIPKENRDKVLVVADGNHIMWVIGHRISEEYKVTENTKTIIELKVNS